MSYPRVILIGGAPMSGKTTVAHMLAATLGYGCLATDDLGEALRAVTTKDSHPHLHPMDGYDYREYYVTRSPDALIADISLEHRAMWPAVQSVIRTHATWGEPIVIEGWSLWPERVTQLRLPSVRAKNTHQASKCLSSTGELIDIERVTINLEGDRWKSTRWGNSLAAYPTARVVLRGLGGSNPARLPGGCRGTGLPTATVHKR